MNFEWEKEEFDKKPKEFKGKMYNIQHTHYMGKAGQLSYGGGKTKEFLEWEKEVENYLLNTEPKEYYYDEGVCELKIKDPIKIEEKPKIYSWDSIEEVFWVGK